MDSLDAPGATTPFQWSDRRFAKGACAEPEDFVKSAAERERREAGEAHRSRGSAWTVSMRQERRPRFNVEVEAGAEPVSGEGVAEAAAAWRAC